MDSILSFIAFLFFPLYFSFSSPISFSFLLPLIFFLFNFLYFPPLLSSVFNFFSIFYLQAFSLFSNSFLSFPFLSFIVLVLFHLRFSLLCSDFFRVLFSFSISFLLISTSSYSSILLPSLFLLHFLLIKLT